MSFRAYAYTSVGPHLHSVHAVHYTAHTADKTRHFPASLSVYEILRVYTAPVLSCVSYIRRYANLVNHIQSTTTLFVFIVFVTFAFSALTLLVGVRKSIRPVKICDEVLVWLSVWSQV